MILYSREVFLSVLGAYNESLWPAQILALPLGLLALALALRPRPGSDRLIAGLLAAAWLWVGAVYFLDRMATIDYAAPAFGGLFILQGLLLAGLGSLAGKLAFRFDGGPAHRLGLGVALFALVGLPAIGWLADQALFGLAPGPTALFTLGLLVLATGWARFVLAVAPLLWCLFAAWAARELEMAAEQTLPVAALVAVVAVLWRGAR